MQTYKKSPPANAHTFADGDFRYITPACPPHKCAVAIRKTQRGAATRQHPPYCFISVSYVLLRFYLELLLLVLRRVSLPPFAFSPPASSELRPSGLTWRLRSVTTFLRKLQKVCLQARLQGASRAPAAFAGRESLPKSCSSTRAAPRPWEQLLGSAPEETGNVC